MLDPEVRLVDRLRGRELLIPPRKWAERYFNLQHWTPMTSGGHFAPSEEPEQLVKDIRTFYRSFR